MLPTEPELRSIDEHLKQLGMDNEEIEKLRLRMGEQQVRMIEAKPAPVEPGDSKIEGEGLVWMLADMEMIISKLEWA